MQHHPKAFFTVVGEAVLKNVPSALKNAKLAGRKIFNKIMSDKLVRYIGAVKYMECSDKSWRGLKILNDKIVFSYFSKLKDEQAQQEV